MMIKCEGLMCRPSIFNEVHPLRWWLTTIKADWHPFLKPCPEP